MKSKNLLFGILALALVFAMTSVGCDKDATDDDGGGDGNGGTLTITGIPSQYNGKYIFPQGGLTSGQPEETFYGCQSWNVQAGVFTLCQISNGRASIPLWTMNMATMSAVRYSPKNAKYYFAGSITNAKTMEQSTVGQVVASFYVDNAGVPFSSGNTTVSWSQILTD